MDKNNPFVSSTVTECSQLDGVGGKLVNDTDQNVTFEGDACLVRDQYSYPDHSASSTAIQDIKSYLARPRVFWRPAATTGAGVSYSLTSAALDSIFDLKSRLRGTYGWRATLVFRLQVANTPYTSGLYRFLYNPLHSSDRLGVPRVSASSSQFAGVWIDINDQTEVDLRIPFTHAYDFFPLQGYLSDYPYGYISLVSFIDYRVGSSQPPPTFICWIHMEDVEVFGTVDPTFNFQAAGVVAQELRSSGAYKDHPITRSVISFLKGIPTLNSVLGATVWASRTLAHYADTFGWAKPNSTKNPEVMRKTKNQYTTNADGAEQCFTLSGFQANSLDPLGGASSDAPDEMSFPFFVSQYATFARFPMTTTDPVGDIIFSFHATPWAMCHMAHSNVTSSTGNGLDVFPVHMKYYTTPAAASRIMYVTPLNMLAQCFAFWRGKIKLRFRCAKTKFHAGRVRISYCPTLNSPVAGTTNAYILPEGVTHTKTVIWDLKATSECEFEVPYQRDRYYTNYDEVPGVVSMVVLDPLICPSTVDPTVYFIVEGAGATDFEFAKHTSPVTLPITPGTIPGFAADEVAADPTLSACDGLYKETDFKFQAAEFEYNTQDARGPMLAIGEKFQSIKQLCLMDVRVPTVPGTALAVGDNFLGSLPSESGGTYIVYAWAYYFLPCFLFWRGSREVSLVSTARGTNSKATVTCYIRNQILNLSRDDAFCNMLIEMGESLHVRIPFLSRHIKKLTLNTFGKYNYNEASSYIFRSSGVSGDTGYAHMFGYRCGDDFQLTGFLTTPPMNFAGWNVVTGNYAMALNASAYLGWFQAAL